MSPSSRPRPRFRRRPTQAPSTATVAAQVWRWDGSSGAVKVSSGIPCRPGLITAANLNTVRVFVGGTEQAIAVQPLRGKFPDGSYRSVAVQFVQTLTNATPVTAEVRLGGATRATSDIAWQEPVYDAANPLMASTANKAVIAVMDSQYLCDSFIALTPLKPEADEVADSIKTFFETTGTTGSSLGSLVDTWYDPHAYGQARGQSTYEHIHGFLCCYVRADTLPKKRAYYQRWFETLRNLCTDQYSGRIGTDMAAWATVYGGADATLPAAFAPGDYARPQEWHGGIMMGLTTGYLMSGWRQPWRLVCYWRSGRYATFYGDGYLGSQGLYISSSVDASPRWNAQHMAMPVLASYIVEATMQVPGGTTADPNGGYGPGRNNATTSWVDELNWFLDSWEAFKYTTANYGAYANNVVGFRPTMTNMGAAGQFPTFQILTTVRALSFYYHNIKPDSRIVTWMVALADFAITQYWFNSATGFWEYPYLHQTPPTTDVVNGDGRWYPPMLTEVFGFAYAATGNATYKTWLTRSADAVAMNGLVWNVNIGMIIKTMGEYYAGTQQSAKYYADGGALRPIAGAHPTTIVELPTHTS